MRDLNRLRIYKNKLVEFMGFEYFVGNEILVILENLFY